MSLRSCLLTMMLICGIMNLENINKWSLFMVALIVGILLMAFCAFACIPAGLAWGAFVIDFLKGCVPVLAAFVGLISVFIGLADLKDKKEAKKEELAARKAEEATHEK